MLSSAEIAPSARQAAITTTAVTVLSFVFLSLKVATRAKVQNRLGWDDGLAIIAYVFAIPLAVTIWKRGYFFSVRASLEADNLSRSTERNGPLFKHTAA